MKNYKQGFAPYMIIIVLASLLGGGFEAYRQAKQTQIQSKNLNNKLTIEQIKNSRMVLRGESVTLKDGLYTSPDCRTVPRGEGCQGITIGDELFVGDINGDGNLDVAVDMSFYCGGAGTCGTGLGVWLNQNNQPQFLDSIPVGYRSYATSVALRNGEISFEANLHYMDDPEQSSTAFTYRLSDNTFVKVMMGQKPLSSWKTYVDTKYGFEFKYPPYLGSPVASVGQIEKLDCTSENYTEVGLAGLGHFMSLQIACPTAVDGNPHRGNKETIIVGNQDSYQFDYTSAVSYHNREVYIPLKNNLYLVFGYSHKTGDEWQDVPPEDFETILSTFVLK